jgi:hypothetical protein
MKMKKNLSDWVVVTLGSITFTVVLLLSFYVANHVYAGVCDYSSVNGECDSQQEDSFGNKRWACSKKYWSTTLQKCTSTTGDGKCATDTEIQCKDCICKPEGQAADGVPCQCRL